MADDYSEFSQGASLQPGASPTVVISVVAAMGRALVRLVSVLRAGGYV